MKKQWEPLIYNAEARVKMELKEDFGTLSLMNKISIWNRSVRFHHLKSSTHLPNRVISFPVRWKMLHWCACYIFYRTPLKYQVRKRKRSHCSLEKMILQFFGLARLILKWFYKKYLQQVVISAFATSRHVWNQWYWSCSFTTPKEHVLWLYIWCAFPYFT